MSIFLKTLNLFIICIFFIFSKSCFAQYKTFNEFLNIIAHDAKNIGIRNNTVNKFLSTTKFIPRVIKFDKSQPRFKLTLDQYLKKVVTLTRKKYAKSKYKKNIILLNKIGNHFGVQPRFLVALWGIETDFGRLTGGFPVISSLASLAYDGRRSKYFKKELINSLKIIDEGHIQYDKMSGSWAGAMGQCQFMPSSFIKFSYDWNKDGKKDIWKNKGDVFASSANYLKSVGWDHKKTWGRKVFLGNFNYDKYKTNKVKLSLKKWSEYGVLDSNQKSIPFLNLKARLIIPIKGGKYGYLVYSNFETLLNWNRSNYFAISVGTLADSIIKK